MEGRDWKKFLIPIIVLLVVGIGAYAYAQSQTDVNNQAMEASQNLQMAKENDDTTMGNAATNDVIVDVNNDGMPEAAYTEGEAMMRDGDSDILETAEGAKTIALNTQNSSGQQGTATLTEVNGKVKVVLNLSGGSFTAAQPAHIHVGSCPTPGAVKYPLTNVMNGRSETILTVPMDELMKSSDKLAINIHKSATESQIYTACGNLQ